MKRIWTLYGICAIQIIGIIIIIIIIIKTNFFFQCPSNKYVVDGMPCADNKVRRVPFYHPMETG